MIVPFSEIPGPLLAPLYVDTKVTYTLDMKKFPGLSDNCSAEPALIVGNTERVHPVTVHSKGTRNGKCPEGELSEGEMSGRGNVQKGKCPYTPVTAHSKGTRNGSACLQPNTVISSGSSCRYKSKENQISLIQSQKELFELLESYQTDYPCVDTAASDLLISNTPVYPSPVFNNTRCTGSITPADKCCPDTSNTCIATAKSRYYRMHSHEQPICRRLRTGRIKTCSSNGNYTPGSYDCSTVSTKGPYFTDLDRETVTQRLFFSDTVPNYSDVLNNGPVRNNPSNQTSVAINSCHFASSNKGQHISGFHTYTGNENGIPMILPSRCYMPDSFNKDSQQTYRRYLSSISANDVRRYSDACFNTSNVWTTRLHASNNYESLLLV